MGNVVSDIGPNGAHCERYSGSNLNIVSRVKDEVLVHSTGGIVGNDITKGDADRGIG